MSVYLGRLNLMRRFIGLFFVLLAVLTLNFIVPISNAVAAHSNKVAAHSDNYERVDPSEFKLELEAKRLDLSNGGACIAAAEGVIFRINDHLLTVTGASNCKLDTEELGAVKLLGTGPFGMELWLTPAQKAKVKALK